MAHPLRARCVSGPAGDGLSWPGHLVLRFEKHRDYDDNDSVDDRETIRRWVRHWEQVGPELEAIRRREIRDNDNLRVIAALEGAFNYAIRALPPRPSSGLVEMQALFARLRR